MFTLGWSISLAVAVSGGTVTAQNADNGLEEQSVNSFVFDPDRGVVRVTIDIGLRNTTTDRTDGNLITRRYFDWYSVAVPLGAEDIIATRDGTVLEGTLASDPERPAFSTYRFALGSPLYSGDSATLQVTYDHHGAPPRNPVPWRVNAAYAGFAAFGFGDDGAVTVRIAQPFGYEFDEFTDLSDFEASDPDGFGTVVHTRTGISSGDQVIVGMSNDDRLLSTLFDVEGIEFQLHSWPDDPEWADFAAAHVTAGIPALEEIIGIRWPIAGKVDVRQTIEPKLYGYAGWFDAQGNEIAVGEELEADTMYHELSHAWFNGALSTERWLTEGLAQVYAAELVRRDGGDPRSPAEPNVDDPLARPITEWTAEDRQRETELYGYNTAFWVVDALIDDIGLDRARDVIAALRDRTSPYGAGGEVARPDHDWQRVYDVFVEVGGAVSAGDVFRAQVVAPDAAALIEQRDRAALEVAGLVERSLPWTLPVGIRHGLESWQIDAVDAAVLGADAVLERRAVVEEIEQSVGIDEPDDASDTYSSAALGTDGTVDFVESTSRLDSAIELGGQLQDRLRRIGELATTALVSPPALATVDGVDDFATGIGASDAQLLALQRIIEVDERLDGESGLLAVVGRWGSDIPRDLDTARAQFERGDNDAALATLDSALRGLDAAAASGALRLSVVAAALLAVLLAFVVIRRRRASRERDASVIIDSISAER